MTEQFDAIVIGAGHAGCEAALALARLSCKTALFTVSVDSIAMMPCNPNVGGTSKGHLVREIDALGGEMGKNIDRTFIQSKMLNQSKGPAVHSLRAQADKKEYSYAMRKVIEETDGVSIKQGEITDIIVEDGKVCGVKSYTGTIYPCKVVVLCTGTYLNARCITGETSVYTGPNGLQSATHLTDSLKKLGISMRRFKTGTPARMDGRTIDYSKMEPQYGDEKIVPFSFENKPEDLEREQVKCWLTYTNEETHKVIRENLDRSPLYSGYIKGTGPRYCPSIEDKVVRFADKNRHQVFIEPEGNYTNEMYVGGMSSSLPEDVQEKMYRSVPGLEHAKIVRNAYAIEYDCLDSLELLPTLELKKVKGLFSAGQANGSSGLTKLGYEIGLISEERYQHFVEKEEQIKKEINRVLHTHVGNTEEVQKLLDEYESTRLVSGISLAELIRRPELSYDKLAPIDKDRPELSEEVREEVNINLKYEGYIKRQQKQVEQFHKLESKKIPSDINYEDVKSLRLEAIQKLSDIRPKSVGQAARISGVSPSDISVLTVYLEQYHRKRVD